MKKPLIITIGILLILLVLGVWIYLLFFGAPKDGAGVFANLRGGDSAAQDRPPLPSTTPDLEGTFVEDDLSVTKLNTTDTLRQLTLRPIAGFGFVGSSTLIRYIERGTGYIYEVDPEAGTETRISGTTIPKVVDGVFSPTGNGVALIAESEGYEKIFVGNIENAGENIEYFTLPDNATQPGFVDDERLRYLLTTDIGSEGYELNTTTGTALRSFSLPLKEVTMLWGTETYLYSKPTAELPGSLYKVDGDLTPVLPATNGFVGGVGTTQFLSSYHKDGTLVSYAHNRNNGKDIQLSVTFIPEKCVFGNTKTVWCASSFEPKDDSFLESWYRGDTQSEDLLWVIDSISGVSRSIVSPLTVSGRSVDVDRIIVDKNEKILVFRNKIDNTLWLYDTR